jgi:hypothetical protein
VIEAFSQIRSAAGYPPNVTEVPTAMARAAAIRSTHTG